jgi:hypothetical protein
MEKLAEEFLLVHDRVHTPFGDDSCLEHFLHGVELLGLLLLDLPDLAKAASANHVFKSKVRFADF